MPCLLDLPEEVLEVIVFLLPTPESTGGSAKLSELLPVLSTHSVLNRIGAALLYRTISLMDCETAYLLFRTFTAAPRYATHVRALQAGGTYPSLPFVIQHIAAAKMPLDVLSFALDAPPSAQMAMYAQKHASELEAWGSISNTPDLAVARALVSTLPQLKPGPCELILSRNRPPLPRDRERLQVLDAAIAKTLPEWSGLRSISVAFRLLGDSAIPRGLVHAPHLERIRTPLPAVWNESLLIASENPSLKRLAVTVTRVKARGRAGPLFVPIPGRVKDSWYSAFPAGAATSASSSTTLIPSAISDATSGSRPSFAECSRAPVEVVSPFGTIHDKMERFLASEERPLSRKQILHDGQGGISAWLIEAREHSRLLELMLAESDAAENNDLQHGTMLE